MAVKINDPTSFVPVTPALTDRAVGVDVSDTGVSADGQTVSFTWSSVLSLIGSTGAPIVGGGWHPYNASTVGPDATGIFYDYATSGATANIVTPTFDLGYEYKLVFDGLSTNSGASPNMIVGLYGGTASAYSEFTTTDTWASGSTVAKSGEVTLGVISQSRRIHFATAEMSTFSTITASATTTTNSMAFKFAAANVVTKVRLRFSDASSFDDGTVKLLRRREYVTG